MRPANILFLMAVFFVPGIAAQEGDAAGGRVADDKPHAFMITTEKWLANCRPYVQTLEGGLGASDEEILLCAGLVRGMVAGLQFGGQLGALGYASAAAVVFQLDQKAMFALFSELDAGELLDICFPEGLTIADIVKVTYARLSNLEDKSRPATLTMYETLQGQYPCLEDDEAGQTGDG